MSNPITDPKLGGYITTITGIIFMLSLICAEQFKNINIENFNDIKNTLVGSNTPIAIEGFENDEEEQTETFDNVHGSVGDVGSPNLRNISGKSADQTFDFRLYKESLTAASPSLQQLNAISGQTVESKDNRSMSGDVEGLPYDSMNRFGSTYQTIDTSNQRANEVSSCSDNAPSFVSSSLLPKPSTTGQRSWNVNAPENVLASQNFLSASQQIGVNTILGSTRNSSYDIRSNIPNPISVVSPWMNTSILPDLERKPLDPGAPSDYSPFQGL